MILLCVLQLNFQHDYLGLRLLGRRVVRADATQPLAAPLLG